MTSEALQRETKPKESSQSYQNPPQNYALYTTRLNANLDLLGWAMRDKKWERAEEILKMIGKDMDALEVYVSGKLHPTTSAPSQAR